MAAEHGWWRAVLAWAARHLPEHVIPRPDGTPYLHRYVLRRGHDRWSVYLHHFVGSDPDALHNHPADRGVSLVLAGGYWEDRYGAWNPRTGRFPIHEAFRRPGQLTWLDALTYHRIRIRPGQTAWTLFFRSARVQCWGFKTPTGVFRVAGGPTGR